MRDSKMNKACIQFFEWLCFTFLFIFLPCTFADIYISEVLYNPFISESGGEAVELYNSGNSAVDLSNYTLMTASSQTDATIPNSAIIPSEGYYLITDVNWQDRKDDVLYPNADYEEAITMKNTDSGIALIDVSHNIIDSVGWGDKTNINSSLYQGKPANLSGNGNSLQRISFTGDNSIDFISAYPNLTNSLGQNQDINNNAIEITVTIENVSEYINLKSFPYDFDNSILLTPGAERVLPIEFSIVSSINPDNVYISFENNNYSALYERTLGNELLYTSELSLPYYLLSGNYSFTILAESPSAKYTEVVFFEVLPLLAFDIDLKNINCSMIVNHSCFVEGDLDTSTIDMPTITNLGNTIIDFKIYADNLSSGDNDINIDSVSVSIDEKPITKLSNNPTLYQVNLEPGYLSSIPLSMQIDFPENILSGTYSTRLILMGVADEN